MTASGHLPEPGSAARAAAAELSRRVAGAVHTSRLMRWLYASDASAYRIVPDAVLVAGAVDDLAVAAEVAGRHGVPLVVRGAASGLAGGAVGPGIAVDCFHLDRIVALDPDRRLARVEPGVIQASLNRAAAAHGLEFGPDTATADQATLGGMAGNNSSGSRSVIYGETVDKTLRLRTVLADGGEATFGPTKDGDLASGIEGGAGARIAEGLAAIRSRSRKRIAADFPQTRRRVSGYNLPELLEPQPNLARLLVGSEGTLALFTEIEVTLDPLPERRLVAALSFPTLRRALEANVAILTTAPSAVEIIDMVPLRRAPNLRRYALLAPLLDGEDHAALLVEYQGTREEAHAGLDRLRALAAELDAGLCEYFADPAEVAQAWQLRRATLPLLMGAPGLRRPATFVEDTAVAPERLADFVDAFQAIVSAHGATASFTGHCSAGCMHVRPMLDLKSAAGVAHMEAMAREVGKLVLEYHGAFSGEHGDGLSRSWFNAELFGPAVYGELVALKELFDRDRLFGPGHVVEGPPVSENLRFGPSYHARTDWAPRLSWRPDGGFDLAVEKCFGAGQCKKLTGTMCPPASATRDEAMSTRARANALQAVVSGALDLGDLTTAELHRVLGTCLACKACKSECPAGVDMAALKAEWLAEVRAREGVPLLARAVANLRPLLRAAAPVAPLADALRRGPWVKAAMAASGAAPQRPAPALARRPLSRRLSADPDAEVVLFADCFIQYQEPEIGEALAGLLRAGGLRVAVADVGCCGRTMMSTGLLEQARRAAARAVAGLHDHVRAGRAVVFVEPSCLSMVHDDWHRLLPGDGRVDDVAQATRFGLALVADLGEAGRLRFEGGGQAMLHPHCHERAVFTSADTERALACVPGLDVTVLDAGCCGMSGLFGYEASHYDLSVAIAERSLLPAVRAAAPEVAVLATGTSCRTQIGDLAPRRAHHPLTLLAARLRTPAESRRP